MTISWPELLILLATIAACGVMYFWNRNQFFERHKINHLKPHLVFGNMFKVMLGKGHAIDVFREVTEKFPKDRYTGIFNFTQPMVVVNDLNLTQKIIIKDFDHFVDHMEFTDEEVDPLMGKILFSLQGDKWRTMRATLSPAFTSSKMRGMLPFMVECADNFVACIEKERNTTKEAKEQGYVEHEMKEFTGRYSNDIIASCAFGLKVDSFEESNNYFYKMSKGITAFTFWSVMKLYIYFAVPIITRIFKLQITNVESSNYFRKLVINTMNTREENKLVRNDMIHLLMQAKKGSLKNDEPKEVANDTAELLKESKEKKIEWTDDELVAQALVFLFAAFDTVSTALGFLLHELVANPLIQKRLQDEVDEFVAENGDNVDYNKLNKMKYMDMVVSEALRLWPPAPYIDRKCIKPYTLPAQNNENGRAYTMHKGDGIWIPIFTNHRNPKIFKNPDEFDPERFSDENKASIHPCAYLPFGGGPRICIGFRFALMEIKLLILYILKNYDLVKTSKTRYPVELKPDMFDLIAQSGLWVGFKKRTNE